jgi:hypothetical protein
MALRYCFEESKVLRSLNTSRFYDLAVIDTDGISTAAIKAACARRMLINNLLFTTF